MLQLARIASIFMLTGFRPNFVLGAVFRGKVIHCLSPELCFIGRVPVSTGETGSTALTASERSAGTASAVTGRHSRILPRIRFAPERPVKKQQRRHEDNDADQKYPEKHTKRGGGRRRLG